jgi:hypothetical protein
MVIVYNYASIVVYCIEYRPADGPNMGRNISPLYLSKLTTI